jgi:O-glycosyl hydrolase
MNMSTEDHDEATPLYGGAERNGSNSKSSSANDERHKPLWIFGLAVLVGCIIGISVVASRRNRFSTPAQEIVLHQAEANNPGDEDNISVDPTMNSFRPYCEYYPIEGNKRRVAPPRIVQTSLHQASQPWTLIQCVPNENYVVELNTATAPDAVLETNFSHHMEVPILGFGGAFTEASALNLNRLSETGRQAALELLFGRSGLGYALGRVHMNSCDFSVQSYNFDNTDGDFELADFDVSVQHDVDSGMIGMVQDAVALYREAWGGGETRDFKLLASPWSPPAWMKRPTYDDLNENPHTKHSATMTHSTEPNCLRDGVGPDSKYAAAWALYFSKFIDAYKTYGIEMWAVTVQNEPEFPAPWEACAYSAANMTDFVAYHLGPILQQNHPNTTILGFDHNKDHINAWMMTMLNGTTPDEEDQFVDDKRRTESSALASEYLGGTAYHWYAGGKWTC